MQKGRRFIQLVQMHTHHITNSPDFLRLIKIVDVVKGSPVVVKSEDAMYYSSYLSLWIAPGVKYRDGPMNSFSFGLVVDVWYIDYYACIVHSLIVLSD